MNSANSSKIDFKNINNFAEDNRDKQVFLKLGYGRQSL